MSDQKAHSEFSMSGFARVDACPASIGLSKQAPPLPPNAAGEHGTNGHTCLEAFFKNPKRPFTVKDFLRKRFDNEMIDHAYESFQEIMKIASKYPGAEVHSEIRVKTDHLTEPGNFGTADCLIIELFGTLVVVDYKYGVMPVNPKDNWQLIGYALGAARKWNYNFEHVILVIVQPRGRTAAGTPWIRMHRYTMKDLLGWVPKFRAAVTRARSKNPAVNPGSHCFFCPSRVYNCPAHIAKVTSSAQDDFDFDDPDLLEEMW